MKPKKHKRWVRCIATTRDGSRCGKYGPPDTQLCNVHANGVNSPAMRGPADDETDDIGELLKRLTRDSDPSIRLRAAEAIMKMKERQSQCPKCTLRESQAAQDLNLATLTAEERVEFGNLLRPFLAFKARVLASGPRIAQVEFPDDDTPPPGWNDAWDKREAEIAAARKPAPVAAPISSQEPDDEPEEEEEEIEGPLDVEVEDADGNILGIITIPAGYEDEDESDD